MKIETRLTDDTVLKEIGDRLTQRRLDRRLSQAQLAEQAGLSKRTVERMEAGESTQFLNLIRVLRVLDLLAALDSLLPPSGPRPLDLLQLKGKKRRRVSTSRKKDLPDGDWKWGEEE